MAAQRQPGLLVCYLVRDIAMLTVFTGCSALPTDLHLHNCINSYATASHSARTQVYPVEFLSAAGQPSLTLQQILAAEIENIFLTGRYFSRYLEMVRLKKKFKCIQYVIL